ncbi:anti-sigma factor [Thioclava sp. FR2]|uniref:anti-sigma factor n=1 Tax=Thioclava sp. FR2 TaxID=3445780 RepID=UPI003EBAD686
MTDTPLTPFEEHDALAAEYVLGVLDLPDRIAAERLIREDATFALAVNSWEKRLAGLNTDFAEEKPSPALLGKIEDRLFPKQAAVRKNWLSWAVGSLAAAALAVAVVFVTLPSVDPSKVVTLATTDQSLVYSAAFLDNELVVTRAVGASAGPGQVHELWIIAPGAAPVSLGLLGGTELVIEYPVPPSDWILAVSVEPEGGSPTGAPTGPVILTAEVGA